MATMWTLVIGIILLVPLESSSTISIINELVQESSSSIFIIRQDHCPQSWLQELLLKPPVPVVLQPLTNITAGNEFSRVLCIVCFQENDLPEEQLNSLLHNIRKERIVFYLSSGEFNSTSLDLLRFLMMQCYKLRILHIIGLLAEDNELFYYRYYPYPEFKVEQHPIQQRPFYAEKFFNMKQQPLIVLPDQKHPRTIIYKDWRTGAQVLAGSVGRFVNTLVWKLNATLQYPEQVQPGHSLNKREMMEMAEDLHVDIPAGLVSIDTNEQLEHTSYPFELSHICLMIPIAQPIPIKDIYLILCNVRHIIIALAIITGFGCLLGLYRHLTGQVIRLVDFLLSDVALRGFLGQSFGQNVEHTPRLCSSWIYLMLGFMGLNLSSIHEAALGTLLTHPPKHFQPRSFADLEHALTPLPLIVDVTDFNDFSKLNSLSLPMLAVNSSEFNHLRDNFNMSHVYFASRLKWTMLSAQQKYFPQEIFLYSKEACFSTLTLFAFQLPQNSWFEEHITRLTMDARATGIYQHWVDMHFYDMAAAGLISFSDPVSRQFPQIGGALQLEDLQWIWLGYAALSGTALVVFGLEVIIKRALD
ncbi:uncharacterized protein LOC117566705 [Drosophila albomicans]|uniref:Uncharacterized protein LOC117566705 n=1 Tax=Drosophila albomicans TaxID=7291 RepID=A0A6P8XXQ0_DROAB|nr:uncharacterized protein LOC117566705 [Drosophila albomicans]